MDLNLLLLLFVAIANVGVIVRTIRDPYFNSRGWIFSGSFVLLVTAIIYLITPYLAGLVGVGLTLLFGYLPSIGFRKFQQHLQNQEYAKARRLWRFQRFLHPISDWSERDVATVAQAYIAGGDLVKGKEKLEELAIRNNLMGQWAKSYLFRLEGDWDGLLDWIIGRFDDDALATNGEMLQTYLRTLGETGRLNEFLQAFTHYRNDLERYATVFPICSMFAFAFCGRRDALIQVLPAIGPTIGKNVPEFWLATADLAAGNKQAAQKQFEVILAADQSGLMRTTIERRLRLGLAKADEVLTPESQTILAEIISTWEGLEKYSRPSKKQSVRPYATYALIGLNLAMFLLQMISGGSQDAAVAYRFGAVLPSAVMEGEWWRLVTALFLHYGFLHLFLNMFALQDLGRYVEPRLGRLNFLLTYFSAGIGSMLVVVFVQSLLPFSWTLFLGASGSILGLAGSMGALMWRAWHSEGVQVAGRQLTSLLIILGIQFTLDLLIPEISLTAHLSGAVIGFLVTMLLNRSKSVVALDKN